MLALPSGFEAVLESNQQRLFVVFELELAAGTLYLADQVVTWGGNTYTRLIMGHGPISEEMGPRVPEMRVQFSNVTQVLEPHLTPSDLITGRRLVARLLAHDSSGDLLSGSVVLHKGIMERPERAEEQKIEITSIGIAKGILGKVPTRNTGLLCNVSEFAGGDFDGTGDDCNYITTGTCNLTNDNSLTVKVDGPAADSFNDEFNRLGEFPVTITGPLPNQDRTVTAVNVTTDEITVNISTTSGPGGAGSFVRFAVCDREYLSCQNRAREFEFQGFRGVDSLEYDEQLRDLNEWFIGDWEITDTSGLVGFFSNREQASESLAKFHRPVPILYGFRKTSGLLVERNFSTWVLKPNNLLQIDIRVVSEGEIDSVLAWQGKTGITRGELGDEFIDGGVLKSYGLYYRPGTIGIDDDETETEYTVTPVTWKRAQNRDVLSKANDPMSFSAYVTFIQDRSGDIAEISDVLFEVRGIKIQKYTNASTPTVDGAKAFSRNPVWQAADLLMAPRYGLGRLIAEADLDFTVIKPEADYCDVTITGGTATVVAAPVQNDKINGPLYYVTSTKGFQEGMTVLYDGPSYPNETDVVDLVPYPALILLGDTRSGDAGSGPGGGDVGDTITAILPRYSSDIVLEREQTGERALETILGACLGFVTYDVNGRIQIRVERDGNSTADYKDLLADQGYSILKVRWLPGESRLDPDVNRVHLRFIDQQLRAQEVVSSDFVHLQFPRQLKKRSITQNAVDNIHSAQRLADIIRKKHRLEASIEFQTGPIGIKQQPGDLITVDSVIGSMTGKVLRIIKKLVHGSDGGSEDALMVTLTCEDYESTVYGVEALPPLPTDPLSGIPEVTLAIVANVGGKLTLEWSIVPNGALIKGLALYKSTATMAGLPKASQQIAGGIFPKVPHGYHNQDDLLNYHKYVYDIREDEFGSPLFFVMLPLPQSPPVYGFAGTGTSNEVSITPEILDPTEPQFTPGKNSVFDGGFEEDPTTWVEVGSAPVRTEPEQDYDPSIGTGIYATPANARDADLNTAATATNVGNSNLNSAWRWTSGASGESGELVITAGYDFPSDDNSHLGYYSIDGGSVWVSIPSVGFMQQGKNKIIVPLSNVTRTDLEFRGQLTGPSSGPKGSIWEIHWAKFAAAPVSLVSGGRAVLKGDGGTGYGTVSRPWPNLDGSLFGLLSGTPIVTQIRVSQFVTPTDPLLVQLKDLNTGTFHTLIGPAAGMPTTLFDYSTAFPDFTWKAFSGRWVAPSDLQGPFEIWVRTLSTEDVYVENLMTDRGDKVHQWKPNIEETFLSEETGQAGPFLPVGAWTTDLIRVADVNFNPF